jgi:hypothetical protein
LEEVEWIELPLLYCMRCALCWFDFSYRLDEKNQVTILEASEGELMPEWYERVDGDAFPERSIVLEPIPDSIQSYYDKLNANVSLSAEEEWEIARVTGSFAREEAGGYPIVDTVNQIGGRAFLQQRLDSPDCGSCRESMFFLAALCNESRKSVRITYDDAQVVFFFCLGCRIIRVQSSA